MNKKLILHFDARNTLFVSDYHSRLTVEKALNTYISGLVWGKVVNGLWSISHEGISTECPDTDLISFYKYMERSIVKNPSDRASLREILGKFTQENGQEFQPIFLENLEKLRWKYDHNPDLTVQGNDGLYYHYILPTFFYALYILYKSKKDFAIVIRTFGLDIPYIIKAIKAFINGKHPLFPERFDIKLCEYQNTLLMTDDGYEYKYKYWNKDDLYTTKNEEEIIKHWNTVDGIIAVKDDFEYWSNNDYSYKASKPLWINNKIVEGDKIYHHIFFDDCIRPREEDSIVHLRRLEEDKGTCNERKSSNIIKLGDIADFNNVNIVQSDLLECINDNNYFLYKIALCEFNLHNQSQIL